MMSDLDPHSLQIIQTVLETPDIPAMSQLSLIQIIFKHGPIGIVIRWIPIDESIEHDGVKGEAPIVGGGMEDMRFPYTGILQDVRGIWSSIEIPFDVVWVILHPIDGRKSHQQEHYCEANTHFGMAYGKTSGRQAGIFVTISAVVDEHGRAGSQ